MNDDDLYIWTTVLFRVPLISTQRCRVEVDCLIEGNTFSCHMVLTNKYTQIIGTMIETQ